MGNQKGKYKRREDFTDEEWKEIVTEAWRLRAEKGWGRVKIARELGISPNTIGSWINMHKTPEKKIDIYESGAFQYEIIDGIRIIKEEKEKGNLKKEEADKMLADLEFMRELIPRTLPYYLRGKRIEKEGDDFHLIYS